MDAAFRDDPAIGRGPRCDAPWFDLRTDVAATGFAERGSPENEGRPSGCAFARGREAPSG